MLEKQCRAIIRVVNGIVKEGMNLSTIFCNGSIRFRIGSKIPRSLVKTCLSYRRWRETARRRLTFFFVVLYKVSKITAIMTNFLRRWWPEQLLIFVDEVVASISRDNIIFRCKINECMSYWCTKTIIGNDTCIGITHLK